MKDWVDGLIRDYRVSKSKMAAYRRKLQQVEPQDQTVEQQLELMTVSEMISDMAYAIEWMRTGHRPGFGRGIDRRGAYRDPVILDADLFPSLQEPTPPKTFHLTTEQRTTALDVIRKLSERERMCYLLHVANGLSYAEIGQHLKLSKRTVQVYIERAKSKAQQAI